MKNVRKKIYHCYKTKYIFECLGNGIQAKDNIVKKQGDPS